MTYDETLEPWRTMRGFRPLIAVRVSAGTRFALNHLKLTQLRQVNFNTSMQQIAELVEKSISLRLCASGAAGHLFKAFTAYREAVE